MVYKGSSSTEFKEIIVLLPSCSQNLGKLSGTYQQRSRLHNSWSPLRNKVPWINHKDFCKTFRKINFYRIFQRTVLILGTANVSC